MLSFGWIYNKIDIFIMVVYYGTMIDFIKECVVNVFMMFMVVYFVLAMIVFLSVMSIVFFAAMIVETTLNTLSQMIKGGNITIRRGL